MFEWHRKKKRWVMVVSSYQEPQGMLLQRNKYNHHSASDPKLTFSLYPFRDQCMWLLCQCLTTSINQLLRMPIERISQHVVPERIRSFQKSFTCLVVVVNDNVLSHSLFYPYIPIMLPLSKMHPLFPKRFHCDDDWIQRFPASPIHVI